MLKTVRRRNPQPRVIPSKVDPATAKPFTLDQELEVFGSWVGAPIWVPPKDNSAQMAESMLNTTRPFMSREARWSSVIETHRSEFSQVREIDLIQASIRLPRGKFFVSVLEQDRFDEITDTIPACVQTRLDEFLAGPGRWGGVNVYYLKPLCVEVEEDLILTTEDDVIAAIVKIQEEVFSEYWRLYWSSIPRRLASCVVNAGLAIPRRIVDHFVQRRQRAIDAFEAKLEFQRRKTALLAAETHRKSRTSTCTFDQMLELTQPLEREEVVQLYSVDQELSPAKRDQLMQISTGSIPWFVSLSMGAAYIYSISLTVAPPLVVCDPVFVAEMPDAPGVLLKIGHFDEVGGITHVEI